MPASLELAQCEVYEMKVNISISLVISPDFIIGQHDTCIRQQHGNLLGFSIAMWVSFWELLLWPRCWSDVVRDWLPLGLLGSLRPFR